MAGVEEVSNKQVILKRHVTGFPKESDLEVKTANTVKLKLPEGSSGVLLKNLYLACDPMIRLLMQEDTGATFTPLAPGSVITGFGVSKVLESAHPNFKKGDLVWGSVGFEEYSLIASPQSLFKIQHTDVPLSYYTGILDFPLWGWSDRSFENSRESYGETSRLSLR